MSVARRDGPPGRPQQPALHDMYRVVALFSGGANGERKFYCQSYCWKRVELSSDGRALPKSDPASQWDLFFIQLTGVEYSLWNAREMEEAAKRGDSIGPQFLRIQHANISAVDPKLMQPPAPDCPFIYALNTAGSNRILFAPVAERERSETPENALKKWINCTRLAVWETARLNEIFTGTMLGLRGDQFCQCPLNKGRFEEAVEVMLPGDTEWRRAFLVVQDHTITPKQKKRLSFLPSSNSSASISQMADGQTQIATASFYATKRSKRPFFTFTSVRYVAAVYPDNQKMIPNSAIFKMEGYVEWDQSNQADVPAGLDLQGKRLTSRAAAPKGEPWDSVMVMPDDDNGNNAQVAMLTCVLAICDAFKLYGRKPPNYKFSFDPRGPNSIYLGYPIGATRDNLYHEVILPQDLDANFTGFSAIRDIDPRESRPSVIDSILTGKLYERVSRHNIAANTEKPTPKTPVDSPQLNSSAQMPNNSSAPDPTIRYRSTPPPQQPQLSSIPPSNFNSSTNNFIPVNAPIINSPSSAQEPAKPVANPMYQSLNGRQDLSASDANGQTLSASKLSPVPTRSLGSTSEDGRQYMTSSAQSHHSAASSSRYQTHSASANGSVNPSPSNRSPYQQNTALPRASSVSERPLLDTIRTDTQMLNKSASGPLTTATSASQYSQSDATPVQKTSLPYHNSSPSVTTVKSLHEHPAAIDSPTSYAVPAVQPSNAGSVPTGSSASQPHQASLPFLNGLSLDSSTSQQKQQLPGALPIATPQSEIATPFAEPPVLPATRQTSGSDFVHDADALAAFSYLDRPPSPSQIVSSDSTRNVSALSGRLPSESRNIVAPRAQTPQNASAMPKEPTSPDHYGENTKITPAPVASTSAHVLVNPGESTFEQSRRLEAEREAIMRQNKESQAHAIHRPGRSNVARQNKLGSYSSEEDEEAEEADNDTDDEPQVSKPPSLPSQIAAISAPERRASRSLPVPPGQSRSRYPPLDKSTGSTASYRASSPSTSDGRNSALGRSTYGAIPESSLGYSQDGILHAGAQQQADQSAKVREAQARAYGQPMIEIPATQGPPTSGLVGAIAEREKDRKREGGIGAAITEREKERQLHDQQLKEARRQSSLFYSSPYMNPMMGYNPYGMMGQLPGQDPMQHQMAMQQAMFAAQQAYMNTLHMSMSAYSQAQPSSPQPQMAPQMSPSLSASMSSPMTSAPMFPFASPYHQPMPHMMPFMHGSPAMASQPFFNPYGFTHSPSGSSQGHGEGPMFWEHTQEHTQVSLWTFLSNACVKLAKYLKAMQLFDASVLLEAVDDASEEVLLLYMQLSSASIDTSKSALGMIDPQAHELLVDFDLPMPLSAAQSKPSRRRAAHTKNYSVSIQQNISRIRGKAPDTSGCAWRISLDLAKEILLGSLTSAPSTFNYERLKEVSVLELGSGLGLLACLTAHLFKSWLVTDRRDCLSTLRKNVAANSCPNVSVLEIDWLEPTVLQTKPDLILAVDVVYNPALALPLVKTMLEYASNEAVVLIACELRSADMLQTFLDILIKSFHVERISQFFGAMKNSRYVVWTAKKRIEEI